MRSLVVACRLVALALMGGVAAADGHVDMRASQNKIDVHAHFLPDFYSDALREAGHTPGPDGMPAIPAWSPELHLDFMDKQNISKSMLSISSPGVYLDIPSKEATQKAINLTRRVNNYAADLKAKYPRRFGYFASLPLPDVEASLAEIEYCFTKLRPRPDGIVLMSNFYGMYLGDPALDPVYKALDDLGVTIFEHPTTPCSEAHGLMHHIDDEEPSPITPKEWRELNRPLATRQFATPTLDFPFESARTFADLFVSQVPSRFSNLKWIIPHAGGGLIPTLDRIVVYSSLYPDLGLTEPVMKAILAKSFYFDLAGPWRVDSAIPALLRWVDYTKIMWGSDVPFTPLVAAEAGVVAYNAEIADAFSGGHVEEKVRAVTRVNARKLFLPQCD